MATAPTAGAYRGDIDGLRGVSVLLVLLFHYGLGAGGGYVGVDVFFVISGYLITGLLVRDLESGRFSLGAFYARRARRILPALLAVLLATTIAALVVMLPTDLERYARGLVAALLSVSNFWFWTVGGYFGAAQSIEPLLHTWSLGVEEQFYAVYPLVLLWLHRVRGTRVAVAASLGLVALVSFAGVVLFAETRPGAVFYFSPFRAWELMLGGLLVVARLPAPASPVLREAAAAAGLAAIVGSGFLFDAETTAVALALPCLGAAVLIWAGEGGSSLAARILRWRPLVFVGLVSYSLYLWHWPLLVLARHATGAEPSLAARCVLALAAAGLAVVTWRWVEQPFRRPGVVPGGRAALAGVAAACLLAVPAAMVLASGGLPARFDPGIVALDRERVWQAPDPGCINFRGPRLDAGTLCRIGAGDAAPRLLVWGDSYAHAMLPAFDRALARQGRSAYFMAESGCPPLPSVAITHFGRPNWRCGESNARMLDFLRRTPGVEAVVVSAAWHEYLEEDRYHLRTPGRERPAEALERGLVDLAAGIGAGDGTRQLVVLAQVPSYEAPVPLAMIWNRLHGTPFPAQTRTGWLAESAQAGNALRTASGAAPLTVIDPADWLCANGPCRVADAQGRPFYRDHGHLTERGAESLVGPMARSLAAALREPGSTPP